MALPQLFTRKAKPELAAVNPAPNTETRLATVPAVQGLAVPAPRPFIMPIDEDALKQYEEAAKAIQFEPGELLEIQLLMFLQKNNIALYDKNGVLAYLRKKAEEQKQSWYWLPLRPQDRTKEYSIKGESQYNNKGGDYWHYGYYNSDYKPYARLVPRRVLEVVKQIEEHFETEKLQFFVGSCPDADSFIMLTNLGIRLLVFDRWTADEAINDFLGTPALTSGEAD